MSGGYSKINGSDGKLFKTADLRINRLGRPRKMNLERLLREVLMERVNNQMAIKGILKVLRDNALKGDVRAAELILDRTFGKVRQPLDTSGPFAIVGIQYIIPNENTNKADPEAARSLGGPEDA